MGACCSAATVYSEVQLQKQGKNHQHEVIRLSLLPSLIWIEAAQSPCWQEHRTHPTVESYAGLVGHRQLILEGSRRAAAGSSPRKRCQHKHPGGKSQPTLSCSSVHGRGTGLWQPRGPRSLPIETSFPHAERVQILMAGQVWNQKVLFESEVRKRVLGVHCQSHQ